MAAVEPVHADLVICRLAQAASPGGEGDLPLRGAALGEIDLLEGDVWIASQFGEIVAVGHGFELRPRLELTEDAVIVDAQGMVAIPGLVDCHTHACFAGDRVDEYDRRTRGASYEELHAAGGGILSTVAATRAAGLDDLTERVSRHLRWMLEQGTTTVEVKSGYGLDLDTELDMLRAIRTAEALGSQRIFATVLAAHAVPPEADDADSYIQRCIDEILPEVDEWGLASAADVFCERGAFDVEQSRRYLAKAKELRLDLRLHGDQFTEIGAIPLAIELEAKSVDHLEATGPEGVAALAASDVIGVMLPSASLVLDRPMPPGRELIDAGAAVALASDFNPGSSFCESLPLVMALACAKMHMTPAEALSACTVNAAAVLGQADRIGRLRAGYQADIVLLDAPDWRYLTYHLGTPRVKHVFCDGEWALEG
ncbi:MAG: imidazolonepropionase [Gaiellales bacterium]|nr:imidazolonepropionase [Gaiellales bacterium]